MFVSALIMFIQPICSAFCDVWNSRMINGVFRGGIISTQFYAQLTTIITLPLLFIFGLPTLIEPAPLLLTVLSAILSFTFLSIYTHALKFIDVSVSQALWNLGAASIPFLGATLFGEALTLTAILGFLMIVSSSLLLDIKDFRRPRLSKGFWLMMLVSSLFSAWILLNKALVDMVGWINTAFYYKLALFLIIIVAGLLLWPRGRKKISGDFPTFRQNFRPFIFFGLVRNAGLFANVFAFGVLPLVVREGISSTQPFFVLMFVWIMLRIGLGGAKECTKSATIIKKLTCFMMMLIGLTLLALSQS